MVRKVERLARCIRVDCVACAHYREDVFEKAIDASEDECMRVDASIKASHVAKAHPQRNAMSLEGSHSRSPRCVSNNDACVG